MHPHTPPHSPHYPYTTLFRSLEPQKTDATPVLKKLSDIRVIAYDFYGTLFISEAGDIGVDDGKSDPEFMKDAFEAAGITTLRDDAHRERSEERRVGKECRSRGGRYQ